MLSGIRKNKLASQYKKSACLRTGKNCYANYCDLVTNRGTIPWVNEIKYLGVTVVRAKKFQVSFSEVKSKFCSSLIEALFSGYTLDLNVVVHLLESIAIPTLISAIGCLELNKTQLNSLNFTLNQALGKIFKVYDNESIKFCMQMYNIISSAEMYLKLKRSFLNNIKKSDNYILNFFLLDCIDKLS